MGIFNNQFANVIEWQEFRDDVIFWKWSNKEIKKGSRLIIRPGQDAIFIYNGKIEGIFVDEGNYEVESQIIPFLSTLKGFKFGFNSGLRAEVLFVNVKELTVKWGTKGPINIPSHTMPGGIPIRSFGTFNIKVSDYVTLIDKVAGIKQQYTIDDVKERVVSLLDQCLMKWIVKEGKDIFNLQINAVEIGRGIKIDIDMELMKFGLSMTDFTISSFNYPPEIQKMIEKNASYSMVGDLDKYKQIGMVDALTNAKGGSSTAGDAMAAGVGMAASMNMMKDMYTQNQPQQAQAPVPTQMNSLKCPTCNANLLPTSKFCNECGTKVEIQATKFCPNCGEKLDANTKFCNECGTKI